MDPHGRYLEAVGRLAAGIAHESTRRPSSSAKRSGFLRQPSTTCSPSRRSSASCARPPRPAERHAGAARARPRGRGGRRLDYLRERVPPRSSAPRRASAASARSSARCASSRSRATAEKAPVDLNAALRTTLVAATNAYKYVADVATDLGELPPVVCHGAELQPRLPEPDRRRRAGDRGSGERGTIRIRSRAHGDHVLVTVADTGPASRRRRRPRVRPGAAWRLARAVVVERHGGTADVRDPARRGDDVPRPPAARPRGREEMAA